MAIFLAGREFSTNDEGIPIDGNIWLIRTVAPGNNRRQ
jgi:hypothetical protein